MFRSRDRQHNQILGFLEEANRDLALLREEMQFARQLSFKKRRSSMTIANTAIRMPFSNLEPKQMPSISSYGERRVRYPSLAEVSKLPSTRNFPIVEGDDEFGQDASSTSSSVDEDDQSSQELESVAFDECYDVDACSDLEIEIFPGVYKPLRGLAETEEAWERGLCSHMKCCLCEAELAFVPDCEFVICPDCETVLPVDAAKGAMSDSVPSLQSSITSSTSDFELDDVSSGFSKPRGVGIGISYSED